MAPQPRCSLAGARAGKLVQRGQGRGASKPLLRTKLSGNTAVLFLVGLPHRPVWPGVCRPTVSRTAPQAPHLCVSSAACGGPLHTLSGALPLPFNRP